MIEFRVLIVDDELYARDELKYLLSSFSNVNIVGEAKSGEEAILKTIQLKPDVIFLDIEMPKMNGIDAAKSMIELKKPPLIVFATAYPQFAAEAFQINAIHYLLKPYDYKDISQTMQRIQHHLIPDDQWGGSQGLGRIAIEMDGEIDYVIPDEIIYITTKEKRSKIITKHDQYLINTSLKHLEKRLKSHSFFRIHRSYLINLLYVSRLIPWFNGAYHIELYGVDQQLPVSRNNVRKLRVCLEE